MSRPRSFLPALLSLTFLVAACGGSDGPTDPGGDDNDNDDTGGETRSIKDNPSFSQDIFEIFTRRGCTASSCHGGGAGDLFMTSATQAYNNLVDVASPTSGEVRVIPNGAANSYLVKKLEGASGIAGSRMPLGGTPLDNIDLTNTKNWINQGAANN